MESLSSWWAALTPALKVYWALAIPFSFLFVGQMIMSLITGDSDHTVDVDVESDHGIGFQFLTLKNMTGFFTIFGWTGIAGTNVGWSSGFTLTIATISGLGMVGIMVTVIYMMTKLNASGTMKIAEAIGKSGEVYLTIPAKRNNTGKIQLVVGGLLRTLDAMTDDEEGIPTGKQAKVSAVLDNNILLVSGH
jgi:hypothetical protein